MSKKITKLITFTEDAWSKAEDIMKKQGLNTPQDAVRYALGEIAKDPAYVEIAKMRLSRQLRTPEDKAFEKIEAKELETKIKADREAQELAERIERGHGICRLLKGKEKKDTDGSTKCEWYIGTYLNPQNANIGQDSKHLEFLTEEDVHKQFTDNATGAIVPKQVIVEALKASNEVWPTK